MTEPRTRVEQLDAASAAQDSEEFGRVLGLLFDDLDRQRQEAEQ